MQAIIVTDEVRTYAIFIYEWMGWTTHTEAGGDTTEGQGGKCNPIFNYSKEISM